MADVEDGEIEKSMGNVLKQGEDLKKKKNDYGITDSKHVRGKRGKIESQKYSL